VARPGSNPGPPKLGAEESPDRLSRGFLLLMPITGHVRSECGILPSRYSPNVAKTGEAPVVPMPCHDIENMPTRDEESRYPSRS